MGHVAKDCRVDMQKMKCYNYDQVGHMKKDCPASKKNVQLIQAYALDAIPMASKVSLPEQEKGKQVVMEGVSILSDFPVRTLFDTGASHSFIASALVDTLDLKPDIVHESVLVSNPVGGSTHLSMICHNLSLVFRGVVFSCDAYILEFSGYELILEMD